MVDYTDSDSHESYQNKNLHDLTKPIPTVVSDDDLNGIIWTLMHFIESVGLSGKKFKKNDVNSYNQLTAALEKSVFNKKPKSIADADNCLATGHYRCIENHGYGPSDATVVVFDDGGNERYQLSFNSNYLKIRRQDDYGGGTWASWRGLSFEGHLHSEYHLKDALNIYFGSVSSNKHYGIEFDKTNKIIDFIANSAPGTAGHNSNAILRAKRLHLNGAIYLSGGYDGIELDKTNKIFDFIVNSPAGTAGHNSNATLRVKDIWLGGCERGFTGTAPISNDFKINYGRVSAPPSGVWVTFPNAFKNMCCAVTVTDKSSTASTDTPTAFATYGWTKEGCYIKSDSPNPDGASWMALGY